MRKPVAAIVLVSALAGCVRTATHFPLIQPRRIVSGCLTWDDGLPRPWTRVTLAVNREPVAAMLTDLFGRYRFDIPWTEQWEVLTGEAGSGPDTALTEPPKMRVTAPSSAGDPGSDTNRTGKIPLPMVGDAVRSEMRINPDMSPPGPPKVWIARPGEAVR